MTKIAIALLIASSLGAQMTSAQKKPTILLDATVGINGGLGYKTPTAMGGVSVEVPFGHVTKTIMRNERTICTASMPPICSTIEDDVISSRNRFEWQAGIDGGSTRKVVTGDGVSFRTRNQIIAWPALRFGVLGGLETSELYTSQFSKRAFSPTAGVVFRISAGPKEREGSLAGRVYVTYLFPTGCQWATASNPCNIQSSRLQGLQIYPEWRVANHVRFGFRVGIFHGRNQGNPQQPSAGRTGYVTGNVEFVMRFQFPGAKYYETY